MKFLSSLPLGGRKVLMALVLVALMAAGAFLLFAAGREIPPALAAKGAARPALTVTLVAPQTFDWPKVLPANGNVVAWQEAVIGPEISNYRITEVLVQVGDVVNKGQVLARIASDIVASELAEAQAAVAELQASASEAKGNAARAHELREKGFYSTQLNTQYQTAQNTAVARLAAAQARQLAAAVKMSKTAVLAPDAGVISARSATVGSLTQAGQELFRLIRGGRLEWRAEVPSADLASLKPGQVAALISPGGENVKGTVRAVAPSVDPQTRNGLVYVDLPKTSAVRAGMFARGEFELARSPALTLPQTAVVLREGFAYVFRLEAADRVAQVKVVPGRRVGERLEIVSGLAPDARVVENGAGFLADGDLVKVVEGNFRP
ncbi:efflux RND transporter periplasmic adaptor subunit [Propionivibrio sp.]|uniref:efflux RND transporter periplasmic adaptor subunit n=1 Tax=Propionivibrio sp. TaxID=2212460 RepID=UPI003BF1A0A3